MAKKPTRRSDGPKPVESIKHKDKRANIPTEELRDFVAEDEKAPKTMLYPRDPSLDPQLVWKGKDEQDQKDYLLWFAKSRENVKYRPLYLEKELGGVGTAGYTWIELPDGTRRKLDDDRDIPKGARPFSLDNLTSQRPQQGSDVHEFSYTSRTFTPGRGTFKTDLPGLSSLASARRLHPIGDTLRYVRFLDDFPAFPLSNLWDDTTTAGYGDPKVYVVQTNTKIVDRCLLMTTDPGDLVLDPTCGSGTTAYVAEQWGRRWITCDTSRVALALARTRLMAARYPYHLLADSPEGINKEAELRRCK
jgi:adenine-specific DNA-methyltransferase